MHKWMYFCCRSKKGEQRKVTVWIWEGGQGDLTAGQCVCVCVCKQML